MKFKIRAKVSPGLTRVISRQKQLQQRRARQQTLQSRQFVRYSGPTDGISGCCDCCCGGDSVCYCATNEWTIVVPFTDGTCACSGVSGEYVLTYTGPNVWSVETASFICGDGTNTLFIEMICTDDGFLIDIWSGGVLIAVYGGDTAPGTASLLSSASGICGWPASFLVACIEDEDENPACDGTEDEGCGEQGWVESGGIWVADGITNCTCGSAIYPPGAVPPGGATTTYCCPIECCDSSTNWTMTFDSPVTTGFAEDCSGYNDTFTLVQVGESGMWSGSGGLVGCVGGGYGGDVRVDMYCNLLNTNRYQVEVIVDNIVTAEYILPMSEWDCEGCNVLTIANTPDGCCGFPGTITVCPAA